MKATGIFAALALVSFASFAGAASAQAVTYDFTGTVETASDAGTLATGDLVTGTFTIDLAAANTATGTTGDQVGYWLAEEFGGTTVGFPSPASSVFSDTVTGSGYSFASSTQSYSSESQVQAYGSGYVPEYSASNFNESQALIYNNSGFSLQTSFGGAVPYNASGLPIFSDGELADGFSFTNSSYLTYTITSIALASPVGPIPAVPETPTAVSLLLGLGLFGLIGLRQRKSVAARLVPVI